MSVEVWVCSAEIRSSGTVVIRGDAVGGAGPEMAETCYTGRLLPKAERVARVVAGLLYATAREVKEIGAGEEPGRKWRKIRVTMERG